MARRWQHGSPSSAAQPALASDGAAQPSSLPGGAAQPTSLSDGAEQPIFCQLPESTTELAVGFYNVVVCLNEIDGRGWKIKERRLKTDIAKAFQHHALDVLCLSALGQLNGSLDSAFEGGIKTWIMSLISDEMLQGWIADSVEQPITIYDDDHYVTIVKNTRVHITHYKIVRGFVPDQEERSFQFFRVRVTGTDEQVCIINCDAPASKTRGLSADGRMCYFKTFHDMTGADPFIWGGNSNTGLIQLAALLQSIDRRYTRWALKLCFSHPVRYKHGDLALTFGLQTAQVNSEV